MFSGNSGADSGRCAFADSIKGDEHEFAAVENAEGLFQESQKDVRTSI